MVNLPKVRRVRSLHSLAQVGAVTGVIEAMEQVLSLVEKARSFHSCKKPATDVGKADTRKHRIVRLWTLFFEKVCLKAKRSTHSLEVPEASNNSTGDEPLYFNDDGQPVFTHMVSVPHVNKHLIKFPIALHCMTLRGRNKVENSTVSTKHSYSTDRYHVPEYSLIQC